MKIYFSADAQDELNSVLLYYSENSEQALKAFHSELRQTLNLLTSHPNIAPRVSGEIRRLSMRTFPLGIYYSFDHNDLFILTMLHLKRNPEILQERFEKWKISKETK